MMEAICDVISLTRISKGRLSLWSGCYVSSMHFKICSLRTSLNWYEFRIYRDNSSILIIIIFSGIDHGKLL